MGLITKDFERQKIICSIRIENVWRSDMFSPIISLRIYDVHRSVYVFTIYKMRMKTGGVIFVQWLCMLEREFSPLSHVPNLRKRLSNYGKGVRINFVDLRALKSSFIRFSSCLSPSLVRRGKSNRAVKGGSRFSLI